MVKYLVIYLIFIFNFYHALSQDSVSYKFYNEASGINFREIYNITSDDNGILYFNSSKGTEYFDGSKFYRIKDVDKNIFNKYPKLSYSQSRLVYTTYDAVYLYNGNSYSLFFKQNKNDYISFLKLTKKGLFAIYSIKTKLYIRSVLFPSICFEIFDTNDPEIAFKNISYTENGDIYISTTGGFFCVRKKKIIKVSDKPSFISFVNEKSNLIYNVTATEVEIYNNKNLDYTNSVLYRNDLFDELNIDRYIFSFYSYYVNGHIYIYSPIKTHNKIETSDKASNDFINDSKNIFDINIDDNLKMNLINTPKDIEYSTFFYTNNNNEFWISTLAGLFKITNKNIIPNYKHIKTDIPIDKIFSYDNKIITSDNYLNFFDIDSSGNKNFDPMSEYINSSFDFDFNEGNYCLYFGKNKSLYIGTIDEGLIEIDSNKKIHYLTYDLGGFDKVSLSVTGDKYGNIYTTGYKQISKIDSNRNITFLKHPQLSKSFIYKLINIDEKIYIFSDLSILVYDHDSISDFSSQLKIFNTNFTSIVKYKNKLILSTINNGIYILGENGKNNWKIDNHLDKSTGMSSNEISKVLFDKNNKLWAFSPYSIDIIIFKDDEYKITSIKNDNKLINLNLNTTSAYIDSNDMLYLADKLGISIFDTKNIKLDSINKKQVNINSFYVNEEKYLSDKTNTEYSLNEVVQNPILNYSENNIRIEFGAIDYSDDKITYKYYLEGLENKWEYNSRENFVSYKKLPSGNYIFHISYSVNGNWSKTTDYAFTILYPWWRTYLAYSIYLFCFILLIYLIYKNKISKLNKKHHEKIKELERKNELLNLQSSAFINQLKLHFIFNALAPLQNFIYTANKEKSIKYLQTFSSLVRNMLNHSREAEVPIKSELEFLEQFLNQQQIEKNNSFDYEIKNTVPENYILPTLMIQPILENCIQYGLSNSVKGLIKIELETTIENYITIKISENGNGFSLHEIISNNKHRALNIINDKISLYKEYPESALANISSSKENNLFTITLILPLKHDD